ncbi:MAG: AAA family ATPase [Legionellaceae bacterium]|nr:AAA family ATPase [Legionellaceae bacterium]
MTIRTLAIQGYRSIQDLTLPLHQVNVITGANGCGKSNVYKAICLLAQAVDGKLAEALALEGGMPLVLWAGKKKPARHNKTPVRLRLSVTMEDFSYELACGLPQPSTSQFVLDPEVKEEYIWLGEKRRPSNTVMERLSHSAWITHTDGNRVGYPTALSHSESVLSQLQDPHLYPELFVLRQHIQQWRFYHHFRTDAGAPMRSPQFGIRTEVLANDGHNLAAALQTILEIGDAESLHAAIDDAFPGATLHIHVDDKARFEVQLKMPGILRPLEARELSDGTLRYLCLMTALLSPRPAPLLALNEPEMSLHTQLLTPLAALIANASRHSQLWVTTHAPELAHMIEQQTGAKSTHLVRTEAGTQTKHAHSLYI